MSIKLMAAVWDLAMPLPRKMILLSLADQANDSGECFPRVETIEKRTGAGRRTVFEKLAELEAQGVLTRVQISKQRTLFKLNHARMRELATEVTSAAGAPVSASARQGEEPSAKASPDAAGAPAAPVRRAHPSESAPSLEAASSGALGVSARSDECASRTGAPAAPVREPHSQVRQPHSTGAPAAPDRCASRTPIKATLIEPPENPNSRAEALIEREDEFNRLNGFDQDMVRPYLDQLPLRVSLQVFAGFVKHRNAKRQQISGPAWLLLSRDLEALADAGVDLNESLKQTMRLGLVLPVDTRSTGRSGSSSSRPKANDDFSGVTYESTPDDELPHELR